MSEDGSRLPDIPVSPKAATPNTKEPAPMNDQYASGGTSPMDPMGEAGESPMEQEAEPQGFTVLIYVDDDGQLSVGTMPGAPEGVESYAPAADKKAALTHALELIKAEGDVTAASPKAAQSASFAAGYEEG